MKQQYQTPTMVIYSILSTKCSGLLAGSQPQAAKWSGELGSRETSSSIFADDDYDE